MTENASKKPNLDYCPYCKVIISRDILSLIEKGHEPVYCEFCGAEIKSINYLDFSIPNDQIREEFIDPNRFGIINLNSDSNPQAEILNDNEFPKDFRESLIIVMSRLIYFHLSKKYEIEPLKNSKTEITEPILNEIADTLVSIINKRVRINFLGNFHRISIKRFEKLLKKLQHKIQSNRSHYNNFIVCLRWLIFTVFKLITEMWNNKYLPKFEDTILKDLKNYGFDKFFNNEKSFTITNSFRGSLYYKVKERVYNFIIQNKLTHADFESEDYIEKILNQLKIPRTVEEIDNSDMKNKKSTKERLINKKAYISVLGKIMIDILDFSNEDSITDIAKRYNVSRDFVTKNANYLAKKHKFKLKDRFPTTSARGSGSFPSKKTLNEVKILSLNFKEPDLLIEKAIDIFNDLITGQNQLTVDDLPLGFKTNPKYLAISLVYYALRHIDYNSRHPRYESYGILEFIYEHFPDDTTMNLAISNTVPALYSYLSESFKKNILYYPLDRTPKETYNRCSILNELNNLEAEYKKTNRTDNIILIELFVATLSYYKEDQFNQFIKDLSFWNIGNKAWRLLEKLSTPDTLRRQSDLEEFIINYNKLIDKLNINRTDKIELIKILRNFKEERFIYYNYNNSYKEKKRRGYERYLTYNDYFFLPSSRIKRFLLMLGFSPYDGFDLWENKILINNQPKIYANFHHYHYEPIDQSENDLVFIPVKPPRRVRTKIYQEQKYLSHNMISGREGHIKNLKISPKMRRQIQKELEEIELRIEHNSKLIEEAVLTLHAYKLDNLKGWSKESKNSVKLRLLDTDFTWAKGIELSIPLTKEYANKNIDKSEVLEVIQEIKNERKKRILDSS